MQMNNAVHLTKHKSGQFILFHFYGQPLRKFDDIDKIWISSLKNVSCHMQSNILSVKETRLYKYEYDCNQVKVVKLVSETKKLGRDTNRPRQPGMNKTKPN